MDYIFLQHKIIRITRGRIHTVDACKGSIRKTELSLRRDGTSRTLGRVECEIPGISITRFCQNFSEPDIGILMKFNFKLAVSSSVITHNWNKTENAKEETCDTFIFTYTNLINKTYYRSV